MMNKKLKATLEVLQSVEKKFPGNKGFYRAEHEGSVSKRAYIIERGRFHDGGLYLMFVCFLRF